MMGTDPERRSKFSSIFGKQKPRVVTRDSDEYRETDEHPVEAQAQFSAPNFVELQKKIAELNQQNQHFSEGTAVHNPPSLDTPEANTVQQVRQNTPNQNLTAPTTKRSSFGQQAMQKPVFGNAIAQTEAATVQPVYQQYTYPQPQSARPFAPTSQQMGYGQQQYQQMSTPYSMQPQPYQSAVAQQRVYQNPTQQLQQPKPKSQMYLIQGQKYITLTQLGSGGSATVFKVMTIDGNLFALKVVTFGADEEMNGVEAIKAEIQTLLSIKGQGITLDLVAHEVTSTQALIVLELGDIDLKQFIRQNPNMSEHRIAAIAEDMVLTVQRFHAAGHIHGDLKPQNFMISKGRVKLIDFGISKKMVGGDTMVIRDTIVGTPKYIAPEVIATKLGTNGRIHRASDVWSIGVILFELTVGYSPFDELQRQINNNMIFMTRIMTGQYQINWNINCTPWLKEIIQVCLVQDDTQRVALNELLKMLK